MPESSKSKTWAIHTRLNPGGRSDMEALPAESHANVGYMQTGLGIPGA